VQKKLENGTRLSTQQQAHSINVLWEGPECTSWSW
jgi:hypothetical protein